MNPFTQIWSRMSTNHFGASNHHVHWKKIVYWCPWICLWASLEGKKQKHGTLETLQSHTWQVILEQIYAINIKKTFASQRKVTRPKIYMRGCIHKNDNTERKIEMWWSLYNLCTSKNTGVWCLANHKSEKGVSSHWRLSFEKDPQTCFGDQRELLYIAQRFIVTNKNGLMTI